MKSDFLFNLKEPHPYNKAEEYFSNMLKNANSTGDELFIISGNTGLGKVYEKQKITLPKIKWLICGLLANFGEFGFCKVYDFEKSKFHYLRAIDATESQWAKINFVNRGDFFIRESATDFNYFEPYESMVRVLFNEKKEGYEAESLSYAERMKSLNFFEMFKIKKQQDSIGKGKYIFFEEQQEISSLEKQIKNDSGDEVLQDRREFYDIFIKTKKFHKDGLADIPLIEDMSVEDIQALLDPDVTLIEYYITGDSTYIWIVTDKSIDAKKVEISSDKLAILVNEFRQKLELGKGEENRRTEDREKIDSNLFGDTPGSGNEKVLYDILFSPLKADIRTEKLIIVPNGILHKMPFAALSDGTNYLADDYTISVMPSSSIIQDIVQKRNPNNKRLSVFANPDKNLPNIDKEISKISEEYFQADKILLKERATESDVKKFAGNYDIIHFACHGNLYPNYPMLSPLYLSKDGDNDGQLQVHEIFELNLNEANLVVLNACQTGLSRVNKGDDMIGLSTGFIYAGTPSILATLWSVDDRSASLLIQKFYENWLKNGKSKPEALREAQIYLKSKTEYKDPFYWAPHVLIGDWK